MSTDQWYLLLAVIVVGALIWALSWHSSAAWHERQAARRQAAADQRTAAARESMADTALLEQRAPFPTYAGWLYDSSWRPGSRWADWQGTQDRQYLGTATAARGWQPDTAPMSITGALDMAEAAYQLGQQRADADQTHAEAEAIWAEVEADPGKWQR